MKMRARRHHHQERHEAVHEEAAAPLDAPRVIDRRRHGVEHAERRPGQRQQAADAEPQRLAAKRVELPGHEIELAREIAEDEADDGVAIGRVRGHHAENRQDQQQKGKQRQQRVVRNRRRVRQARRCCRARRRHATPPAPISRRPAERARGDRQTLRSARRLRWSRRGPGSRQADRGHPVCPPRSSATLCRTWSAADKRRSASCTNASRLPSASSRQRRPLSVKNM